jgi:DsbC/DsbD-like thiol-disulfide interchange protein
LRIDPRRTPEIRRSGAAAGVAVALATLALAAVRPAAGATSPWASNPQSQVRLISGWRVAPRTGDARLGVEFRLAPGWHAYWKNSGDAGFAPVVTFAPTPGLGPVELLWPAPHRFALAGGLEAFGYQDEVVYPLRARLAAGPSGSGLRLTANVDYVVCAVDCVPHRYDLTLDQALGNRGEVDPLTSPLLDRWRRELPLAAGERAPAAPGAAGAAAEAVATPGLAQAEIVGGTTRAAGTTAGGNRGAAPVPPADLRFELRLRGAAAAPEGADLFFEPHPVFEPGRPRVTAAPGALRFEVPMRRKDASAPLPAATEIAWTATGLRLAGTSTTVALAGRQPVVLGPTPDTRTADRSLRGALAAADPRLVALAAAAAALLTLEGWGLLRRPAAAGRPRPAAKVEPRRPLLREALGFLALLSTPALLYALSLEISPEGLAVVELVLLAMGLAAWLRRRIERRGLARLLLAAVLAAGVVATPWLAARHRLAATGRSAGFSPSRSSAIGPSPGLPAGDSAAAPAARRPDHRPQPKST